MKIAVSFPFIIDVGDLSVGYLKANGALLADDVISLFHEALLGRILWIAVEQV